MKPKPAPLVNTFAMPKGRVWSEEADDFETELGPAPLVQLCEDSGEYETVIPEGVEDVRAYMASLPQPSR